jgi:hypothetical protein
MMTEEFRQIMSGPIESFTPGETVFKSADNKYSARVYQTISRDRTHCIVKLIEGYDMARMLNTIRAKHRKGVVKFDLLQGADYTIGFYTNFVDSNILSAEFHKTPVVCKYVGEEFKEIREDKIITQLEIKNGRCRLDIDWNTTDSQYSFKKVVIHLKKPLNGDKDAALIALDEVLVERKKYMVNEPEIRSWD